ncbi:MAG: hypothetical protein HY435_02255 [Candidatus Liptonbacteria bacterium]|nr:hypothetical protein [Candidatus Liptonbacteria bacterium]
MPTDVLFDPNISTALTGLENVFGGGYQDQLPLFLASLFALIVLLPLFLSTWLFWRNEEFKKSLKWLLLEIKIPREIDKSPRAMEQILSAIHALRNVATDIQERYWDGEVTRWYSFEIVSFGGEIHFYIRLYYKQRDLVEAAFFSFYKDVEIVEVDDYVDQIFPKTVRDLYAQGYDMWGSEMKLVKPSAYPIRTYEDFEHVDEEKQFDPISAFLEVLAKIKKEEIVGIQILASPADRNWNIKWQPVVEKLRNTSSLSDDKKGKSAKLKFDFPSGPLPAISVETEEQRKSETGSLAKVFGRTPGETDVLKAVEENLSKPAFETVIRFIYFSPKSLFYDSYARRGLTGAFNQYGALDLNSFTQNYSMSTRTRFWTKPYIFPGMRNEFRKQRLLYLYNKREFPTYNFIGKVLTSSIWNWNKHSKTFEMNIKCLATLFHPPTRQVLTAPHIPRVESRKTGPPAGLAIFGDEEKIEKFM